MKVGRLKELLNKLPDNLEIYIRHSYSPCGTIAELENVEHTNAYTFGEPHRCVVLNTCHAKKLKEDEKGDYIDYEENDD